VRRDVRTTKWKPVSIAFILALSAFFGVFGFYGVETATGTVVGGHISVDTVWDLARSPYIVMENVIVDPGVTLTIEPGVDVKFDPPGMHDYLHIYVEGNLVSVGQTNAPINFTTNENPPHFGWGSLQINSTGMADLTKCNLSHGFGLYMLSSTPHNVSGNHFYDSWVVVRSPGHNINNNTHTYGGISSESSDNTISGNSFPRSSIWLHSGRNTVTDNTFSVGYAGTQPGVEVYSDSNIVENNILRDMNDIGIRVRGSWNVISSNSIISCTKDGIDLGSIYPNNTVSHNEISGCRTGIDFSGSDDNRVLDNKVSGGSWGMRVGGADRNLIVGNEVIGASICGIRAWGSTGNRIHHNILIDNVLQAYEDNSTNSWDNGYPSGGNYWSDYQGNDTFSGPNQDIPGSDGIGDIPYTINPNGTDRFPFTEPTKGTLPPRNLNTHLTGTNYENVTITWNISWNDGQRANDVTGYEIYRSSTYDMERVGYSLLGSTPNQTTQYADSNSGEGDPNNYFYYVCAINGTGNSSCSSDQAAKFTRPLSTGPNLVSIPLIQSDETLQTVLQTVSYDNAWSYDAINQEWKSFMKSKPYAQSLEYLNHTMGIWVNVTQDSNLTVAGVVPTLTTINLQAGWNLVGFPSFDDNYAVADLKAAIAVERIEGYNALAPPYFLRVMTDGGFLQAGFGYWIRVGSGASWTTGNS
jgi:parallel beta-helix repeat protein